MPRTPGIKRRNHKDLKKYYTKLIQNDKTSKFDNFNINQLPLEPDSNVLKFISENDRHLAEWERDLIRIVEQESLYFIPQAFTKIMNEGWACMIHEKIVQALGLPAKYHISFMRLHNQVVRPHLGQINPYHLGYKVFKHIEEKHGFDECLRIREVHNDETFLKAYLDRELCQELNLFSFSFDKKASVNRVAEISDDPGWQTVRDDLIKNVGLNSVPVVLVKELQKNGTLVLEHQHDGRDIELSEANKVFEFINNLWSGDVKFTTVIEEEVWEF